MLCQNCGNSIVDTARFCSFCGVQQRMEPSSQPASGEASGHSPMSDAPFEASDVTVILPRRRVNALVAQSVQRDKAPPSASAASKAISEKSATHRLSVPAMKIGAVAVIAIIAVFAAVAFYANRPATPVGKVVAAPAVAARASATKPMPAPTPRPMQSDEPDGASPSSEAPSIAPTEAHAVAKTPITNTPSAPEATPQLDVSTHRTAAPPKKAARRNKERTSASPMTEPAPAETPAPRAVEIAPPARPLTPAPPIEPVKVEKVACTDSSNPFSRELCLWQECAKPEYRSHAECARFTGTGSQR